MDLTYVDAKNLKNLEDYAMSLFEGLLSLRTLEMFHIKAIEIGILTTEDLQCRGNTLIWELRRNMKLYMDQLDTVLELLPVHFNYEFLVDKLKKQEMTKARSMTRKSKKCDT